MKATMKAITLPIIILALVCCNHKATSEADFRQGENAIRQVISNRDREMDTISKFDIERYKKNISRTEFEYNFKDAEGNKVRQFDDTDSYIEYITYPNQWFVRYNEYDGEGRIRKTGQVLVNNGFHYGLWKFYDSSGRLINKIDQEKPYKFTWEDVLIFIEKENIDLAHFQTSIARYNTAEDGKGWYISWDTKDPSSPKPLKSVKLDGDNGKVLSEMRYEMEY